MEGGRTVLTASFHLKRGYCCGNGCRHCPYTPKHQKGTEQIKVKRPDNEVYDEERGHYAKILPYGSNVGAPSFHGTDLTPWKTDGVRRVNNKLYTQLQELKSQYTVLMQQVYWNDLVYNSKFNFEPIVGHVYYLYEAKEGTILSIISPEEWGKSLKLKWIGSFKLTSDKTWEVLKVAS